jgi:crotonobetainyl-CoA:carnitine CoA-transferase CaiB-like acyl-CoA transferase
MNAMLSNAITKLTASELFLQIHKLKIPAGIIQNVREVLEMKEAKSLLLSADSLQGIRTYVASGDAVKINSLLPPPHFGEHTEEILKAINF